jgi:membrane fusion protein, multidrug efflux system
MVRVAALALVGWLLAPGLAVAAPALATHVVQAAAGPNVLVADGVIEATRQSVIAAQVPARIVEMKVRAGDVVKAGQVLLRLDNRAAAGEVAASEAQAASARVQLDVALREYERSQRLFAQKYISQAAMDVAEAKWKSAEAQKNASVAQAGVVSTQSTFTTLVAPFAGVVAVVNVEQGDLATPGMPLLTLYDPAQLRVVASVPEGRALAIDPARKARIDIGGAASDVTVTEAVSIQVLPTVDPATHSRQVRLTLPERGPALTPGTFARVQLPLAGAAAVSLTVPVSAVVRRPEFNAVYVVTSDGKPQLRQVRLGRTRGDLVEVVSGLATGERVALDPVAAARQ